MNGRSIRIWRILGTVDWWWLMLVAGAEFWARHALRVPAWIPSLTELWILIQGAWLKRAEPTSNAIYLFVAWMAIDTLSTIPAYNKLPGFAVDVMIIFQTGFWLSAIFVFRHEMRKHFTQVDPRGLELSGVMTFFFSTLYFQYWFRQIYKEQTEPDLSLTLSRG